MSGENNNETTSTMTMLEKPISYVKEWFDGMDNVVKMAIGVILAVCLVACSWNILQFVFFLPNNLILGIVGGKKAGLWGYLSGALVYPMWARTLGALATLAYYVLVLYGLNSYFTIFP